MNLYPMLSGFLSPGLSGPPISDSLSTAALVASLIFVLVLIAIMFHLLHETAAVLLGAAAVFLVTYIAGSINPELQLLTFEEAMSFVDWNVIFLILGMMILMAILSSTNVIRWLGLHLYQLARGNKWLIAVLLISLT